MRQNLLKGLFAQQWQWPRARRPARRGWDADVMHAMSELSALLPQADFVALTCPLTAETEKLIDADAILVMRVPALTGRYEFLSFQQPAQGRAWLEAIREKVPSAKAAIWRSA